jgi:AraC-like DNA-binding protein
MALAKEALKCGSARIEEIGFAIGYKSASAFSTALTRAVGCAPKPLRKLNGGKMKANPFCRCPG